MYRLKARPAGAYHVLPKKISGSSRLVPFPKPEMGILSPKRKKSNLPEKKLLK